jgi:hypothetical protein
MNLKIDAGVVFMPSVYNIISIKYSQGSMLVSAYAPTVYAV